jgi:hypothetical protein
MWERTPEQVAKPPAVDTQDVSEGAFGAGDAIPFPKGERVLSISGLISNVNDDDETTLDVAPSRRCPWSSSACSNPSRKKRWCSRGFSCPS